VTGALWPPTSSQPTGYCSTSKTPRPWFESWLLRIFSRVEYFCMVDCMLSCACQRRSWCRVVPPFFSVFRVVAPFSVFAAWEPRFSIVACFFAIRFLARAFPSRLCDFVFRQRRSWCRVVPSFFSFFRVVAPFLVFAAWEPRFSIVACFFAIRFLTLSFPSRLCAFVFREIVCALCQPLALPFRPLG
jgi:hypothetical protein